MRAVKIVICWGLELPSNLREALDELESRELREKECGKQAYLTISLMVFNLTPSSIMDGLIGEVRTVKISHPL